MGGYCQRPGLAAERWDRRLPIGSRGDLTAAGPSHAQQLHEAFLPSSNSSREMGKGVDSASGFHWVSGVRARPPLRRSLALACPAPRPVPVRPLAADARPPARPPRRTAGLVVPPLRPHHGGARAVRRVLGSLWGPLGCLRYSRCDCLRALRAPWRHPPPASLSAAVRPALRPRRSSRPPRPSPGQTGPSRAGDQNLGPGGGQACGGPCKPGRARRGHLCAVLQGARVWAQRRVTVNRDPLVGRAQESPGKA